MRLIQPLFAAARAIAWLLFLAPGLAWSQDLRPVPELRARVIDQTGTLSASQSSEIESTLAALEAAKGSQLVLLIVSSTAPEDIASYANRVANVWKIGRRDVGDGVLLIVAKDDRRVRIEVSKALEGAIPDLAAKRVIDEAITPAFRQGDFAGGLATGVGRLAGLIQGEALPAPPTGSRSGGEPDGGADVLGLLVFAMFALPIASAIARSVFGRKLGALLTGGGAAALAYWMTASLVLALLAGVAGLVFALISAAKGLVGSAIRRGGGSFPSTGGWSGGGGGFGSSGGFGSGGGGDFGGGGASGNW
jgi:uncharacterized protein